MSSKKATKTDSSKGKLFVDKAGKPIVVNLQLDEDQKQLIYGAKDVGKTLHQSISEVAGKDKADDIYLSMLNGEKVDDQIEALLNGRYGE